MDKEQNKLNQFIEGEKMKRTESMRAFELAIKSGILSDDSKKQNYAGDFMYMGIDKHTADYLFKHVDTRKYLNVTDPEAMISTF